MFKKLTNNKHVLRTQSKRDPNFACDANILLDSKQLQNTKPFGEFFQLVFIFPCNNILKKVLTLSCASMCCISHKSQID